VWVDTDNDDNNNNEGGDEDEEMTVVDSRDHAEDGDKELRHPYRGTLSCLRLPPLSVNVHVCALPAYYESEGRGRSRRHPSRIHMHGRRHRHPTRRQSGRGRGKESRWAGSGSGGHHVACYRHVRHNALSAFPESSPVSVSEYCIHPHSLACHDCS
jgi:hypothetical protein